MRRSLICVAATCIAAFAAGSAATAHAQAPRAGTVIVPPSNVLPSQDRGTHSHTNFLIFRPSKNGKPAGLVGPSPAGETPSSLACVYQVGQNSPSTNCPVVHDGSGSTGTNYDNPTGGSNIIAIVDAYDYPSAKNDFNYFSAWFGLPYGNNCGGVGGKLPCFTKVPASGTTLPRSNSSWAQEEALDIEWAHAMAPYAQIVLVEAASNSNKNLFQAVNYASSYIASHGGEGEVSMSWGGSESASETTSYDPDFTKTPFITYFASSGDSGGKVIYPSASPYVVSAGGTTVNRDSSGNFLNETTWSSAGGGPSSYEAMPGYQDITADINRTGYRGTPDISFDANPYTGVSVYDTTASQGLSGWLVFGGTSVASPSLAGIVNSAGAFGDGSNTSVQNNLYSNYATETGSNTIPATCSYSSSTTPFNDITSGSAGTYSSGPCWDFASGIGSLRGLTGPTGSGSGSTSPSSVTVSTVTFNTNPVTGGNSTTGTVTLSGNAPSGGASVSLLSSDTSIATVPGSVTVPGGSKSTTFTVSTSAVTTSSSVDITASYNNSSAIGTLQVSAPTGGTFSIAAADFSLNVGGTGSTTVTVSSPNFTGSVTLSVSGLPSKFANGSFSTNPVTVSSGSPGTSTFAVRTNKNVAPGIYYLTFTGTSGGLIVSSPKVTLTIN